MSQGSTHCPPTCTSHTHTCVVEPIPLKQVPCAPFQHPFAGHGVVPCGVDIGVPIYPREPAVVLHMALHQGALEGVSIA